MPDGYIIIKGGRVDIGKKLRRGFRPIAKQLSKANPLAYKPVQSLGAKFGDITNNYLLPAAVSAGKPLLDASMIAASTALTGNPFLGQMLSDVVWEEGVEKTGIDPRDRQKSKELGLLSGVMGEAGAKLYGAGGKLVSIEDIPKTDAIWEWSNPNKVAEKAKEYLGKNAVIFRANKPKKKYMVFDPNNEKWIYFGEMSYQDHTKHNDPIRRENYLRRTANMKGDWKNNRYSANNLSRNLLW